MFLSPKYNSVMSFESAVPAADKIIAYERGTGSSDSFFSCKYSVVVLNSFVLGPRNSDFNSSFYFSFSNFVSEANGIA